jgi:hypothetical protein
MHAQRRHPLGNDANNSNSNNNNDNDNNNNNDNNMQPSENRATLTLPWTLCHSSLSLQGRQHGARVVAVCRKHRDATGQGHAVQGRSGTHLGRSPQWRQGPAQHTQRGHTMEQLVNWIAMYG